MSADALQQAVERVMRDTLKALAKRKGNNNGKDQRTDDEILSDASRQLSKTIHVVIGHKIREARVAKIYTVVTKYRVENDQVVESTATVESKISIIHDSHGDIWLQLDGGPQSMPLAGVREAIRNGGWSAQAGTEPVKVDGHWGGRNYPKVWVDANQLEKAWKELLP